VNAKTNRMVMDWNPIVSAGVGGLVGVLGSVLTQRVQVHRDKIKNIEERATGSATSALEILSEFHSFISRASYEASLTPAYQDWEDNWLESDSFQKAHAKLTVQALVIPQKGARQAIGLIADRLSMSWLIGSHVGVDGDRVALELCDYARDVLGRFLRGEKSRRPPSRVRMYWRAYEKIEEGWEAARNEEEKSKREEFARQQRELAEQSKKSSRGDDATPLL
jgi:hypothetical protein